MRPESKAAPGAMVDAPATCTYTHAIARNVIVIVVVVIVVVVVLVVVEVVVAVVVPDI